MKQMTTRRMVSIISLAYASMFAVSNLANAVIMTVADKFFPEFAQTDLCFWLSYGLSLYIIGGGLFMLIMRCVPDSEPIEQRRISAADFLRLTAVSFASCYLFNLVGAFIISLLEVIKGSDVINPLDSVVDSNVYMLIIFSSFLSPVFEEIVFRGILIKKLRRFGDMTAAVFSSLIFASYHANFSQFFYAFALGLIFAYTVVRTGRIRYSVILHVMINLVGSVIVPKLAAVDNQVIFYLIDLFVLAMIAAGITVFSKNLSRIRFNQGVQRADVGSVLLNPGFAIYAAITVVSFYINVFIY